MCARRGARAGSAIDYNSQWKHSQPAGHAARRRAISEYMEETTHDDDESTIDHVTCHAMSSCKLGGTQCSVCEGGREERKEGADIRNFASAPSAVNSGDYY